MEDDNKKINFLKDWEKVNKINKNKDKEENDNKKINFLKDWEKVNKIIK